MLSRSKEPKAQQIADDKHTRKTVEFFYGAERELILALTIIL